MVNDMSTWISPLPERWGAGAVSEKHESPREGESAGLMLWRQRDEEKLRHPVKQEERRCRQARGSSEGSRLLGSSLPLPTKVILR